MRKDRAKKMAAGDAQILAALKAAHLAIVVRGAESYGANGRTWTALDIAELQRQIGIYEARVAADAGPLRPAVVAFRTGS